MPYVDSSGVSIHYHVEGDGPPLVLQHGLTSSLQNWYAYGFVEELQKEYRVIMVDARGHGRSGKPHDPKGYDLKLRVNDVLAVMDDLGVSKAHYMGYSMGGRIGFGIVLNALDRFHSLIIGGMSADTPTPTCRPKTVSRCCAREWLDTWPTPRLRKVPWRTDAGNGCWTTTPRH